MSEDRVQAELRRRLDALLGVAENKFCIDCGVKGTGWASTNLGLFMCLRCSGIHRSLGTHITKVKSCSLDKWAPEMVAKMEEVGNGRGKRMYEARVPSNYPRPNGDQLQLEQWIRKKYQYKEFFRALDEAEEEEEVAPVARVQTQAQGPRLGSATNSPAAHRGQNGTHSAPTSTRPSSAPPRAQPAPAPAPVASLLLMDFAPQPASPAPANAQNGFGAFPSAGSGSPVVGRVESSGGVDLFASLQQAPAPSASPAPETKVTKADIMQLYQNSPAMAPAGGLNYAALGGGAYLQAQSPLPHHPSPYGSGVNPLAYAGSPQLQGQIYPGMAGYGMASPTAGHPAQFSAGFGVATPPLGYASPSLPSGAQNPLAFYGLGGGAMPYHAQPQGLSPQPSRFGI